MNDESLTGEPFVYSISLGSSVGDVGTTLRSSGGVQGTQVLAQQVPNQRVGWLQCHLCSLVHCQHCGLNRRSVLPECGQQIRGVGKEEEGMDPEINRPIVDTCK